MVGGRVSYPLATLWPMNDQSTPDQRADRLASRQHGAIALEQCLACGLTPRQIRQRVASRRWLRPTTRVFVVARSPATWQRAAMAASLAGPPGTLASHLTAAALHGLWRPPPLPHVSVPRGTSGRLRLAKVHWSTVSIADRTLVAGIPCTTPARTLVDCSAILPIDPVTTMADSVLCRIDVSPSDIEAAIVRAGGHLGRKGIAALRQALSVWAPGIEPASPAEIRLVRRLLEWGFDRPATQAIVTDDVGQFVARLDVAWVDRRVGLEYDSLRFHDPRRFQHHEARYRALQALGWRVRAVEKGDILPGELELRDWLRRAFAAAALSDLRTR
jgi:hypothetical protein